MGRILLLVFLVAAFVVWRRWKRIEDPSQKRAFASELLLLGLVAAIIVMALFGRIDILGAVFASLLLGIKYLFAFLIRNFPLIAKIYGASGIGGNSGSTSRRLKTPTLELDIDFSNGRIDGSVLQGPGAGKDLTELNDDQLNELFEYCQQNDSRSAYLLRLFLAFRAKQNSSNKPDTTDNSMSREQALEILGLEGEPDVDDIKQAHKRLMQKLHPDRGGNDFLASLVNRARDILLS